MFSNVNEEKYVFVVVIHSIYRDEGIDDCSISNVFESLESANHDMFLSVCSTLSSFSDYGESDFGDTIEEVLKFVKDKEMCVDIDISDTKIVVNDGAGNKITIFIQKKILQV